MSPFTSAWRRMLPGPPGGRRAVLWLGLLVAGWTGALAAAEPAGSVRLQLKWHHQFQFAGYYAAQAKGFFTAEGLTVEILEGRAGRAPITSVLNGTAHYGVSDSDVLLARLRGQPIVVCAAIFQHSPYVIMSRADRGIRTSADLIGKKIMMADEQGAAQLQAMLAKEGIAPRFVTVVPYSWDLADLIEGRVDAVSACATVEPAVLRARGVEPAVLRSLDYGVDFYGDTLFTTEPELARHPARVAALVPRHPPRVGIRLCASGGNGGPDPHARRGGGARRHARAAAGGGAGHAQLCAARGGGDRAHESRALAPHRRVARGAGRGPGGF